MVSRSELATRLAGNGSSHAQAVHAVDAVLHEITAALVAGERVALTGFGTFEPVARPARTARNPRTGEAVQVPAATVARFRPGAGLRGALLTGDAGTAPGGALPPARPAAGISAAHAVEPDAVGATGDADVVLKPRHGKDAGHPKAAKPSKSAKLARSAKHGTSAKRAPVADVAAGTASSTSKRASKAGSKTGPKAKKGSGSGGKKSKGKR